GVLFFFEAEDGIRDWSVTGVQTCALPICERLRLLGRLALGEVDDVHGGATLLEQRLDRLVQRRLAILEVERHRALFRVDVRDRRSEERRVGKEGRARWAREREKSTRRSAE